MKDILNKIDSFRLKGSDWSELNELLTDLEKTAHPEKGIVTLFKVLERYHDRDDHVLWEVGHAVEDMKGFKQELVNSLKRQPSDIGIMILNAYYNDGVKEIGNESMTDILKHLENHPKSSDSMISYIKEAFEQ
ncbi:hypothetical protein [Aquimarina longa]|uniref:hypothetical protein n=1 Tax=Aquimarina longa TaxID=1080221 RepID=UPI000780CE71|nr:hypothetical protein [Aquimarina longa]